MRKPGATYGGAVLGTYGIHWTRLLIGPILFLRKGLLLQPVLTFCCRLSFQAPSQLHFHFSSTLSCVCGRHHRNRSLHALHKACWKPA